VEKVEKKKERRKENGKETCFYPLSYFHILLMYTYQEEHHQNGTLLSLPSYIPISSPLQ
jgi:hypothetical protein